MAVRPYPPPKTKPKMATVHQPPERAPNRHRCAPSTVYGDGGFEPVGDEAYVLSGESSAGDPSGGVPAVLVTDGLLILATSAEILVFCKAPTGPDGGLITRLEAAGDH